MSGTRHVREMLAEAQRMAAACGIAVRLEPSGAGHPKLIFEGRGTRRVKPLSRSPKNVDDAAKRSLADIRRLLRDMAGARR